MNFPRGFFALALLILIANSIGMGQKKAATGIIVPIVDLKLKGLIGGVRDGNWVKADEVSKSLKEKSSYFFLGDAAIKSGPPKIGVIVQPEPPCEDYFGIEMDSETVAGLALGTSAKWNVFPRKPLKLYSDNAAYQNIAADFLKKKGLKKTVVRIKSAFKIDLDGDKQDEVVIAGTYYKNGSGPSASEGDYSFVIVRKIIRKNAVEILLEGDFITKDIEFGAPNEYDISAIADLNGDGIMEIVVYGEYYEGAFSTVFEIAGDSAKRVLETGCGV